MIYIVRLGDCTEVTSSFAAGSAGVVWETGSLIGNLSRLGGSARHMSVDCL